MGEARRELLIVNKRGLHARASAKLVGAVVQMPDARVRVIKGEQEAEGDSILDVMMLGAGKGDSIIVCVTGEAAAQRLAELAALVEAGFGEE